MLGMQAPTHISHKSRVAAGKKYFRGAGRTVGGAQLVECDRGAPLDEDLLRGLDRVKVRVGHGNRNGTQ